MRSLVPVIALSLLFCPGCSYVPNTQPEPVESESNANESVSAEPTSFDWPARWGSFANQARGVVYEDIRFITDWQSGRIPNDYLLPPDEIDEEQIQLLLGSSAQTVPAELTPELEVGGGFIIRPIEGEPAGSIGEYRQYLTFVSGERDDLRSALRIQRTWFTFAEPKGAKPRGLAILMPGMFATPRDIGDRAERGLLMRGWAVLRMLSPPSRMSEHTVYQVPLDHDRTAVMEQIAFDMDTRVAEAAYAVKAMADHVVRGSSSLPGAPRIIIGMSGSAIALPTIVAYEPKAYDAAVLVAGGANSFSIARRSSYREWIDAIGFEYTPRQPTTDELATLDAEYLEYSKLDGYHTAEAMADIPALMIHGATDTAVPADTGELLWERLGKGERWVMPVGHELVFAALPVRMVAMLDWLEEKTAEPSP